MSTKLSSAEWKLAGVIAILSAALAVPLYADAFGARGIAEIREASKRLHRALLAYRFDHGKFPSETELDSKTLAPLSTGGYLRGATGPGSILDGHRLIYFAPDVGGEDRQFVAVVQSRERPRDALVVAHTDMVAHPSGRLDGVYAMSRRTFEDVGPGSR